VLQDVLISVIVPVYNAENYLERCVDSLLAQTHTNLEVILCNDGSKDGSGRICDSYAQKDPRVKALHLKNGGASSARNAGLDIARGEYITFADSDDWVEPDAYAEMLRLARENDARLVCAGRYNVLGQTGEQEVGLCPQKLEKISGEELLGRVFLWDNVDGAVWDKLFHRSVFREIRFPLGKINEDILVVYQAARDLDTVVMYNRPVYYYFHHVGSVTNSGVSDKTFHFAEITGQIYPEVREKHPAIAAQAEYFRVRSLVFGLQSLLLADRATRVKYDGKYRSLKKELGKHAGFVLTGKYFTVKERAVDLLILWGLYLPVHKSIQLMKKLRK